MAHRSKLNRKSGWQMVNFRDRETPKCQVGSSRTRNEGKKQRLEKLEMTRKGRTLGMCGWHLISKCHVF